MTIQVLPNTVWHKPENGAVVLGLCGRTSIAPMAPISAGFSNLLQQALNILRTKHRKLLHLLSGLGALFLIELGSFQKDHQLVELLLLDGEEARQPLDIRQETI